MIPGYAVQLITVAIAAYLSYKMFTDPDPVVAGLGWLCVALAYLGEIVRDYGLKKGKEG
jgi:hypothetical protein